MFLADAIPFDQSSIVATGGGRVIVVPVVATPVVFQDEVPLHRGCLVLILAAVAVAAYAHHGGRNVQVAKRTEEERGRVVIVIPLQAGGAVRSVGIPEFTFLFGFDALDAWAMWDVVIQALSKSKNFVVCKFIR